MARRRGSILLISWEDLTEQSGSANEQELQGVIRSVVRPLRRTTREQTGRSVPRNGAGSCLACNPYSDEYLPVPCPNCNEPKVCAYCAQCDNCGKVFCWLKNPTALVLEFYDPISSERRGLPCLNQSLARFKWYPHRVPSNSSEFLDGFAENDQLSKPSPPITDAVYGTIDFYPGRVVAFEEFSDERSV